MISAGGEQLEKPVPPPGTECCKVGCGREAVYYFELHHVADSGTERTFQIPLCRGHAEDSGQAVANGKALNFRME